jgi:hypothetical protein
VIRRLILFGAPAGLAVLAAIHPPQVGERMEAWMAIHVLQLPLLAMLAVAVLILLDGVQSRTATVARLALPFWVAGFAAFDAIAGLVEGTLADYAGHHPDEAAVVEAIRTEIAGAAYVEIASTLALASAAVAFGGAAFALYRSGASVIGALLIAVGGVVWTLIHPLIGAAAMVAFLIGAWLVDRSRPSRATADVA